MATLLDDWQGSTISGSSGTPQTFTNPNFANAGIVVTQKLSKGTGFFSPGFILFNQPGPIHGRIDLGALRNNVQVTFPFFGTNGAENLRNFVPAPTSVSGAGVLFGGNGVNPTAPDGTVIVNFAGPVQYIDYDWNSSGTNSTQQNIQFDTIPVLCDCCPLNITRCRITPAAGFSGRLTNVAANRVEAPVGTFTYTNFAGSGVNVTISAAGDTLAVAAGPQEADTLAVPASSQRTVTFTVAFSSPVYLRSFGMTDLDFGGSLEYAYNFTPQISGVYGQKQLFAAPGNGTPPSTVANNPLGVVRDSAGNGTGGVTFNGPLASSLQFRIFHVAGAGSFLTELAFDTTSPITPAHLFLCDGSTVWYDSNGLIVPTANIIACP